MRYRNSRSVFDRSPSGFQILATLFIIVVLVLAVIGQVSLSAGRKEHIEQWANQRNWQATKVEHCIIDFGPYWYLDSEDYDVYRVEISDSMEQPKVVWFAFGTFRSFNTEED